MPRPDDGGVDAVHRFIVVVVHIVVDVVCVGVGSGRGPERPGIRKIYGFE